MSTTIKRVALVAVAALGLGVVSVAPSVATVSSLTVATTNGTATTTASDSSTAATITVSALVENGDSVTVNFINKDISAGAAVARLYLLDTATSSNSLVAKGFNGSAAVKGVTAAALSDSVTAGGATPFVVYSSSASYAGAKFGISLDTATTGTAGTYSYTAIVKSYVGGVEKSSAAYDLSVVVAALASATKVVDPSKTTAFIQAGTSISGTPVTDSVVAMSSLSDGTVGGVIRVKSYNAYDVVKSDTITVSVSGPGVAVNAAGVTGKSFVFFGDGDEDISIKADGVSGLGTITITTGAGNTFVKTVNFFSNTPATVTAAVKKAYIKAGGTAAVNTKVFAVTVKDAGGALVTNATISAAATDTTTTVGGAATCGTFDTKDSVYYCAVAGLSTIKFGAVGYTIKATGADAAKTVLSTTASTTFADSVATKIVIAGPATTTPGATVEYTLTATEKNGYPVADLSYGVNSTGGNLFAKAVASGWAADSAPFLTTDSFTSVSGVMTSEGVAPIAGVGSVTWTLVGDGITTATADAVDKTIGKTTITVATAVSNPGVDAATDAANEAAQAASDATDAALAAADAADAATTKAQEAVDAVATLSAQVSKLITALKAQITTLTNLVIKIQKKVRA